MTEKLHNYNTYNKTMKTHIGNDCSVDIEPFQKSTLTMVKEQAALARREGKDEPFIICDLGDIIQKYTQWCRLLPRVKPFYAVKCNDDYGVVRILANCGAGFDCASRNEIQKILSLGVEPSRIIYANPCKQASMIKYAAKNNVEMMTFDSEAELHKIKCLFPDANFHVGSGCKEAEAFAAAIQQARMVFNLALEMGFHMTVLDIGGGYPGQENADITFSEIAIVINRALDKYFPDGEGVEIIAEPGRYMVASAFTLAVNIIAKKIVARDMLEENDEIVPNASTSDEQTIMYYVNDGIYGSFNCLFFDNDHQTVTIRTLKDEEATYECSVWGPTCDSIDCIVKSTQLPMHEVGDWLYIQDMGAYTVAAASTFNGMQPPSKMYHCLEELWYQVKSQHDNFESKSNVMLQSTKNGHSVLEAVDYDDIPQTLYNEGIVIGQV